MTETFLAELIDHHTSFYKKEEKEAFDRARRLYRGKAWHGAQAPKGASRMLSSKNMVYAIADTAVSSLLGPDPKITCQPKNRKAEKYRYAVNGVLSHILDSSDMRGRSGIALVDAVLCGRGIFKSGFDPAENMSWISETDPSCVFFDLGVRHPDDISYWMEATQVRMSEVKRRIKDGVYRPMRDKDGLPDQGSFPPWLANPGSTAREQLLASLGSVTIWEYYSQGEVIHYHRESKTVLLHREMEYQPYSLFYLNHNDEDCRGLSEVQLILPQQRTINELLTLLKQVTYLQIPRMLYDKGQITETDLQKIFDASLGAFVGVSPENSEALRNLGALFYQVPVPENSPNIDKFLAMMVDDVAFISALAEMARGKVTGARTATEMALIDTQMRTRLSTREGHFNRAISQASSKAFKLAQQHMRGQRSYRPRGSTKWYDVNHAVLRDIDTSFSVKTYNPIQNNPGVMAETVVQLWPLISENPYVRVQQLTESVFQGVGLPMTALKTEEEVAEEAAEMAEAEAQAAQIQAAGEAGGVPGALVEDPGVAGPAGMPAQPPVPPQAQPVDPQTGQPLGGEVSMRDMLAMLGQSGNQATQRPPA